MTFTNLTDKLVVIWIIIGEKERIVIVHVSSFTWRSSPFITRAEIAIHVNYLIDFKKKII